MSQRLVQHFAIAAPFVKYFKMDDVFLGIIARKFGITPRNNANLTFNGLSYDRSQYRYVLAAHLDHEVQIGARIWNDQLAYMVEIGELPAKVLPKLLVSFPTLFII